MFFIPGQTIEQWDDTLNGALVPKPDHISA